jgi:preprotein translocase subunit SecD
MSNPVEPVANARRLPWLWLILGIVSVLLLGAGLTTVYLVARGWDTGPDKGDAQLTLHAVGTDGQPPSAATLDQTRQLLLSRMKAADLTRPTVSRSGSDGIVVTVARQDADRARALLTPGSLAFRKVIDSRPDQPAARTACPGSPGDAKDHSAALASAKAKIGAAVWDRASQYQAGAVDPTGLEAFTTLNCAEVAALDAPIQFFVPTVTCAMLNGRAPGALDQVDEVAVACDQAATTKYLLDAPKVRGTDLADAIAENDPQQGGWHVRLHFTTGGQSNWTALTKEVLDSTPNGQGNMAAIVIDNEVLSAPQILQVIPGDAIISGGGIDEPEAKVIAATLRYGALPVHLTIVSINVVS